MIVFLTLIGALILDRLFGDPRRFHPLAGFGRLVAWAEARWHRDSRARGTLLLVALVLPWVVLAWVAASLAWGWLVGLVVLTLAIGWRSLDKHAERVAEALESDQTTEARAAVGMLVSRDTDALDTRGVSGATVESVLENGNDAVFATIFWFLVAGAPGVIAYRLVNTLDAMWGYRSQRYRQFGWAAARMDDAMNYIPARLTALAYALAGNTRDALQCWREQAPGWKSPNAGPVMSAGAGALGIVLGGPAPYSGRDEWRPRLGMGRMPDAAGIRGAIGLVDRALAIWLGFIVVGVVFVVLY
ncbi:adenosylcobinamide-phosphate synthase CbiB [Thioalkalivibrio sp. ALJ1]|uniref:adenosylcobinamide-phosphate synthase CbiB n=1 Tax=Thioalkalivibrio sp. ALJ1 TaxID=1158144 RepID=UPI00056E044B|nr:adenosylcobinamide-phosphate synthase CbiB [Thioalkalivibrio sp. ALJ1]